MDIIVISVCAGGILVFCGYVAFIEKRSVLSKLLEMVIPLFNSSKYYMTSARRMRKKLTQVKKNAGRPYRIPVRARRLLSLTKATYDGMDYFVMQTKKSAHAKHIFYIPGGGYIDEPSAFHWFFLHSLLKEVDAEIYVPIYPKAPLYTFKDSFPKTFALYVAFLAERANADISLMGDSAGAGYALAIAQELRAKRLPQPKNIILLSPWVDITLSNPGIKCIEKHDPILSARGLRIYGKLYAGDLNPKDPRVSPLYADLRGLADMTIFAGTHDILHLDARAFCDRAQAQGVKVEYHEYPKMIHTFTLSPLYEGKKSTREVVSVINGSLNERSRSTRVKNRFRAFINASK